MILRRRKALAAEHAESRSKRRPGKRRIAIKDIAGSRPKTCVMQPAAVADLQLNRSDSDREDLPTLYGRVWLCHRPSVRPRVVDSFQYTNSSITRSPLLANGIRRSARHVAATTEGGSSGSRCSMAVLCGDALHHKRHAGHAEVERAAAPTRQRSVWLKSIVEQMSSDRSREEEHYDG